MGELLKVEIVKRNRRKNKIFVYYQANLKLSTEGQRRIAKEFGRHWSRPNARSKGLLVEVVMDITTAMRSNDEKRRTDLLVKELTDMVNSKLAQRTQNQVREWYAHKDVYHSEVPGITHEAVPMRSRNMTPETKALRRSPF